MEQIITALGSGDLFINTNVCLFNVVIQFITVGDDKHTRVFFFTIGKDPF